MSYPRYINPAFGSTQQIAVSPAITPANPGLYSGFFSVGIGFSLYLRIAIVQLVGFNYLRLNIHPSSFPPPDRSPATCKAAPEFAFSLSNQIGCRPFSTRAGIPRSLSLKPETRSAEKSPFCTQNQPAHRN